MPRRQLSESEQDSAPKDLVAELQQQIEELTAQLRKQGAALNQLVGENRNDHAPCVDRPSPQKIPELIKLIPTFDGAPSALVAFIESVEQKLRASEVDFTEDELTNLRPIWTGLIRDKIVGRANEILIENQTPLVWEEIKVTLKENLGDKREISTLLTSVSRLRQGPRTIDEFYQKSRALLTSLNTNTILNNQDQGSKIVRDTYEVLVVNAFIDGLHDNLIDNTRAAKPKTLLEAYHAAHAQQESLARRKFNAPRFAGQQNAGPSNFASGKKYPQTKNKQTVATHEEANGSDDDASGDEANFQLPAAGIQMP